MSLLSNNANKTDNYPSAYWTNFVASFKDKGRYVKTVVSFARKALALAISGTTIILEEVMLILTRKVGEALVIGDEINVTVLGVKGNQVRIGVNAPREVAVHREEIYERIQEKGENGSVSIQES